MKLTRFIATRARALAASLLCTVLSTASVSAAISYDAVATKTATNASSVSWSHTVGSGTDRILIVGLATEDTSASVLTVSPSHATASP